jgi:hypothetical protein
MFDKLKGAVKDVKSGMDDPLAAAGEVAQKLSPKKITKRSGGSVSADASVTSGSANTGSEDDAEDGTSPDESIVKPVASGTSPAPTKGATPAPAPGTPPASGTPPATDEKAEGVKKNILGVLQNDEAGKKVQTGNPKNLETIAHGAAYRRNAQEIVDDLRAANGGTFEVTNDVRHVIGKALGEAGRSQDTSTLKESKLRNIIRESFYMKEADNDSMSDSKTPVPGDMVWWVDTKALTELFKTPEKLTGKIKYNKFKVEFVDLNKEDAPPKEELTEHIKSLFYEAEEVTSIDTSEDTPKDTPEDVEKPKDTSKPDKKSEKMFDAATGSAKVTYLEGPEKGKQVIVKLTDLEIDADLMTDLIKFGYYQADINNEKADTKYKKIIALSLYQIKHTGAKLEDIPPDELSALLVSEDVKAIIRGDFSKLEAHPDIKKIAVKAVTDIHNMEKTPNSKTLRIQKIEFDKAQKISIMKGILANKPLTKKFVLDSHKITKDFEKIPDSHVSKVNYGKGFNWFKIGGMVLGTMKYVLTGKFLKDIASKLQGAADSIQQLSGTKTQSNIK